MVPDHQIRSYAVHIAGETRFYGAFITAERMLLVKAAIMQTVVSQEWADWTKGASAKVRDEAVAVKALALDESRFWGKLEVIIETFAPVVKLLKLTDSHVPAASKVKALYMLHALLHNVADMPVWSGLATTRAHAFEQVLLGILLHVPSRWEDPGQLPNTAAEANREGHFQDAMGVSPQ